MNRSLLLIATLALVGCSQATPTETQNPSVAMEGMTLCQKVAYALNDRRANATTKSVAMEVGRNNGCFGQPPVQRVQIDHTVRVTN